MTLKRCITTLVLGALAFCTFTAEAANLEDRGFEATLGADLVSTHLWRGIKKHSAVFQPSFEINLDDPKIGLDLWTNINLGSDNSGELTESRFTADYSMGAEDFWITVGGIFYNYATDVEFAEPGSIDDTIEAFATFEWLGGMNVVPSLSLYIDFDEAEGVYGELSFAYQPEPYMDVTYEFEATLGYASSDWNEYYLGVEESSFVNMDLKASMEWPLQDNVTAKAYAGYSAIIDEELKDATTSDNNFYGGLGLYINL